MQYIRKKATLAQAEEVVRATRQAGIIARLNFMLGFPISTRETISNTIRFAKKLKPDIVRFFAVAPLPNTDLWNEIYGESHQHLKWEEIDFFQPSFDIQDISRDQLSLYIAAGYWHTLKGEFFKEITLGLLPNMIKLLALVSKTKRIRGNLSKTFPRSVNLILDNLHQIKGKPLKDSIAFLKQVQRLENSLYN